MRNWANSYLPPLRQTFKALSFLFKQVWLKTSPTVGPIMGFPRVPVHGKPGKGIDYQFVQFPPGSDTETIETDVVIVGSGCGGGVCAKNLAEDGHRVLVVEKAYHFPPEHLPMSEADAGVHLFMNGGVDPSDDNSISVIAGQAWGGGGTVNWSASLQTQGYVRREWADAGLPFFTSAEYQNCLDRVCHRMGVSADHIEHNFTNNVMLEGARKLGYNVKAVPQNTGGNKHYCGYCTLGCGAAEKQGPVISFLPDAERAGAKFIEGFDCEKVIFDETSGRKVAIGVQGTWTSRDSHGGVSGSDRTKRKVFIKAKKVIVSCGTLQSPLLLLRSGLQNAQIGRNLYLHPVNLIGAIFPQAVNPWEGGILTSVSGELEKQSGTSHGVKLEAMTMLPGWWLTFQPWLGGLDWKLRCAQFKHMTGFISLARDRDAGRVYPDPVDGRCRIAYTPSAFDKRHILEGMLALARICYVQGAEEIFTVTDGVPSFRRDSPTSTTSSTPVTPTTDATEAEAVENQGINDPSFQSWLDTIRKTGLKTPATSFGSAHQMGTCRMGASPRTSVVDPRGRVWDVEGLYVADASVFPSASGVNPMVTNMAIADWISRGVARDVGGAGVARL